MLQNYQQRNLFLLLNGAWMWEDSPRETPIYHENITNLVVF